MAVEDHPKFGEWSSAVDALKAAADDLQSAIKNGEWPGGVRAARAALAMAQIDYDRASREIGDA